MSTETVPPVVEVKKEEEAVVVNQLAMSDEDFLKQPTPSTTSEVVDSVVDPVKAVETEKVIDPSLGSKKEGELPNTSQPAKVDAKVSVVETETKPGKVDKSKVVEPTKDAASTVVDPAVVTPPNYEELYNEIMKPFKANGKTIQLKDPAEAIQLMQMGANYTRKMQDIQPHRKVLLMLENNGLLDAGKLSYLIDLDKKNPEAIKKLVKDAGINPLEIDTEAETTYRTGNHTVPDEEVVFRTTLDELSSSPEGKATLQVINTEWDQASKEVLWTSPQVMTLIHQQRENGIYAMISTEIDRMKTLGKIPATMPFMQAYKEVGDLLTKQAEAAATTSPAATVVPPAVVATRTGAPKATVTANAKASAASPTRTIGSTATKTLVNPLALSDEDFMKMPKLSNR